MSDGLEGIVAAETMLSQVDGQEGRLIVRGHDLEELAGHVTFEGMAALLWDGFVRVPRDEAAVRAALGRAREQAFAQVPMLIAATQGLPVGDALRAGLAGLPRGKPEDDLDHILATAAVPVFVAALLRARQGQDPVAPTAGAGQVEDFLAMLHGTPPAQVTVDALETYLVTVADHGMNASTFTARVVASTQAGVIASVVAAYCALTGPLHGGAPGPVLDMFDDIGDEAGIQNWIDQHLGDGERLMGFGHRVYRTRDPRADVLKGVVARVGNTRERMDFAEKVERAAIDALAARYPERNLDTNVELFTAVLLEGIGLPRDLFTPMFAMGRVLGWTAHVLEQVASNRLIRPASRYIGPAPEGMTLKAVAG